MKIQSILITGACGQIGTVLTGSLRQKYGGNAVIATDIVTPDIPDVNFEYLDATDAKALESLVSKHRVTQIYHLAAILSAKGEEDPMGTWDINMTSLINVLEISKKHGVEKIFFPSSIAVFGSQAPLWNTPQNACLNPTTMYGVSKVAAENLIQYYHAKYNLDVRSLRYPGIIGYQSLPGGGTTDYAVDIYHKVLSGEEFICFLEANTTLPMIFMEDAIRATLEIMEAPSENIRIRTSYNLSGISFAPKDIVQSIQEHFPDFKVRYEPDFRQKIADSWPKSIDDSVARADWGWVAHHGLKDITRIMLEKLKVNHRMAL